MRVAPGVARVEKKASMTVRDRDVEEASRDLRADRKGVVDDRSKLIQRLGGEKKDDRLSRKLEVEKERGGEAVLGWGEEGGCDSR